MRSEIFLLLMQLLGKRGSTRPVIVVVDGKLITTYGYIVDSKWDVGTFGRVVNDALLFDAN